MGGYIENPIKVAQPQTNSDWKTFNVTNDKVGINFFKRKGAKKKNTKRLFQNEVYILYKGIAYISNDEYHNVINKLLFRFLYETRCRISAVLGLIISDFSEPSPVEEIGTIYIRKHDPLYHKDHSIKTNERDIPVSMDLIYALDDYLCTVRPQKG